MTFPLASISPSVRHGVSEKNLTTRQEIPKFVRSTEVGIADRTPVASKDSTPQNFHHVVRTLYNNCETLGMEPGELRGLTVANQLMTLYRTRTGDAYVLQTPEDARASIRNGLHIDNKFNFMLDREHITPGHPRYAEAVTQAHNLLMAFS